MSELPEYVLDREFKAPRKLVWKAWTDPELLSRWYGPGVETIIHKFDLKPEGLWLGEMRWSGNSHFSKVVFKEVNPHDKLTWHHSSSDAEWNIIANPMMKDWPRTLLTIVTFTEKEGQTNVQLKWIPLDATDTEIACFAGAVNNMGKGWESGYAIMDEILAELLAEKS